jgi:hypothetical protein
VSEEAEGWNHFATDLYANDDGNESLDRKTAITFFVIDQLRLHFD